MIQVFGPETHITAIVPLALKPGHQHVDVQKAFESSSNTNTAGNQVAQSGDATQTHEWYRPFSNTTRSFVYGMQPRAVQGILDFDFICKRKTPSVAAIIYPFGGGHLQKFYWGTTETMIPVFPSLKEAIGRFPEVDTIVNFASCRSVYPSTFEMLEQPQIKTIAIIAEGVPERRAREYIFRENIGILHAGPMANSDLETADAKNKGLRAAGAIVPETPKIPVDYSWAVELGLVRKPASFVSTISDDRGQELLYAGMPISEVFKEEIGIGHKIKSRNNPDLRVKIITEYAKENFPSTPILDYALAVEQITCFGYYKA